MSRVIIDILSDKVKHGFGSIGMIDQWLFPECVNRNMNNNHTLGKSFFQSFYMIVRFTYCKSFILCYILQKKV